MDTATLVRYLERNTFNEYGREAEQRDLDAALMAQAGRDARIADGGCE